ncbi:hypothetical protein M422DRAFT_57130 [Sphaerobolus stellatus SS14]|uniref:Right handed beta helix domain-containing protein n=1 Tax=Sphaerobolus stellatus (strain SS14) TaxID=990650 RepID=A0A0C9UAV2_SPHS4|nr:hypothetical protein M422DRAFT_57130 [Sphaerobolus stellatus SS14]
MVSFKLLTPLVLVTFVVAQSPPSLRPRVVSRAEAPPSVGRSTIRRDGCEPADPSNTVTARLNNLLTSGGAGYVLTLCQNQNYLITAPITFTASNQEIITQGLPTDDSRAMITVTGPAKGTGNLHTTAVMGTCANCDGIKLRHVQINGTRNGNPGVQGGANIEMGGNNAGQVVEFVHSFDPRAWSCLHITEGELQCNGAIVQNNDIGPCGSDAYGQWADGISISCADTIVRNNLVKSPTDGGIVIFGSPGTLVENNTIWIETVSYSLNTLLGGINMVDYTPWSGNYSNTVVRKNNIIGGLATDSLTSPDDTRGTNNGSAIIKIGIAIGPHTWFGNHYLAKVNEGGTVLDNQFEGAFGYAIALTSAYNFTVQGNTLVGNTSFIGSRGPNCSTTDQTPQSEPFVIQTTSVNGSNAQSDFANIVDGNSLICVVAPPGGDFWPFGKPHGSSSPPPIPGDESDGSDGSGSGSGGGGGGGSTSTKSSTGKKVGIAVGVVGGILFIAIIVWFSRRRARKFQVSG